MIKVWRLAGQFGGPAGYSDNSKANPSSSISLPYNQGVAVPVGQCVVSIGGTFTVRAPGELLWQIIGPGGQQIWAGNARCMNWNPVTLVISQPIPASWNLCGLIYVMYQQISFSDQPYQDGEFHEYQLTLYGQ